MQSEPADWSAVAPNLAEHADNPIHTDPGAQAAGYPAAIVAGTTVFALMTHPPAAAWGLDWLGGGGCEVRFRAPVLADDMVSCRTSPAPDGRWSVEEVAREQTAAQCTVWLDAEVPAEPTGGEPLPDLVEVLDEQWAGYGRRAGDDLALYDSHRLVHPAAWPCLANRIFARHLIDGAWIHTRSLITHVAAVPRDTAVVVQSVVTDRFETRAGERAVVDCRVRAADRGDLLCVIEHEALVALH